MAKTSRELLIDHALRLFVASGYDAVGVQQIVEAAGVTKPTLYHWFGSKLGLLKALLADRLEPLLLALESSASSLHELARMTFAFVRARPAAYRLHLSLWLASPRNEAHKAAARLHRRQFAVVQALLSTGAASFLALLNGYIALALNGHAKLDDDRTDAVVHQFLFGVRGRA